MQILFDAFTASPLHGLALGAIVVILVLALIKSLLKIALITAALGIAYGYYLHQHEKPLPRELERVIDTAR